MVTTVKTRPARRGAGANRVRGSVLSRALLGPVPLVVASVAMAAAIAVAAVWSRPAHSPARSTPGQAVSQGSMTTVATIDGQAVPVRELALFLAQERAATFAYFHERFGAGDHPGFWTTAYGARTPRDYLKSRALKDVTRVTVEQQLARRHSLVTDTRYAAFRQSLAEENARRRDALARHQPVYGPTRYREADYFTYVTSRIGSQLEDTLVEHGDIPVTGTLLRRFYGTHRADYGQSSFDEVTAEVRQDYTHAAYQSLIDRRADAATVVVRDGVLAAIQVG
ncbi:hypothetical protein [Streptomyces sp. NPDC051642]|uniref:hypothetical protein n=1 Tax=unclassified Streptomyces TaxID=2593676 RepID=UPI0034348CFA